ALRENPALAAELRLADLLERVGPAWLALFWVLPIPFILALFMGADFARFTYKQGERGCPPFIATLPISNARLIQSKLLAAALCLLPVPVNHFWRPQWRPILASVILVLLAGKLVGTVILVPRLIRERLAAPGVLAWMLTGWVIVAVALVVLANLALPGEWMA